MVAERLTKVGSIDVTAGGITKGFLELGEYPDGFEIVTPVIVAQGLESGPTLWVQSCVHGSEIVGPLATHAFLAGLEVSDLAGTIVFVLAANPLAYRGSQRLTPHDGGNLNNAFPGSKDGPVTEQIAFGSFDIGKSVADAVIDLHSGGDHLVCCHHVLYFDDGSGAGQASRELTRHLASRRSVNIPSNQFRASAMRSYVDAGIPAVIVESGGGSRVTQQDIANHVEAIKGGCRFLGIAKYPGEKVSEGGERCRIDFARARRGGIFEATAEPGCDVSYGEELGRTVNLFGDVVERHTCECETAWLAAVRRPYMSVFSGDDVAELVCVG